MFCGRASFLFVWGWIGVLLTAAGCNSADRKLGDAVINLDNKLLCADELGKSVNCASLPAMGKDLPTLR